MKTKLIKKLRLKKGCKYILFFDVSSGFTMEDGAQLSKALEKEMDMKDILFVRVKDNSGVKIIEYERDTKNRNAQKLG